MTVGPERDRPVRAGLGLTVGNFNLASSSHSDSPGDAGRKRRRASDLKIGWP